MTHVASEPAAPHAVRKSGGPACEVCGDAAHVAYADERYFCLLHAEWPLDEIDGVFHELEWLAGDPLLARWYASGSQVARRDARMRAAFSGWRTVLLDWSIGPEVDTE